MNINKLNINNTIDDNNHYSVVRKTAKGFIKGATKGAGVAGIVNTVFPALVPTFTGMIVGSSSLPLAEKIAIGLGASSNPAVQISGLGIIGIGAGIGALAGGTFSLVKNIKKSNSRKR